MSVSTEHLSFGAQAFHYFRRDQESIPLQPIEEPAAWVGSGFAERDDWHRRLLRLWLSLD